MRKIIQNTLDYVENNLKAEISTEELCKMSGYSYTHYCRLFQHYVGLTLTEYITRRKLLHAIYDICNGGRKIEVALSYGFETYSGFYKAFRREFNCSPSEFIHLHKGIQPYRINILQEEHILLSKSKIKGVLKYWNLQDEQVIAIYSENTGRQKENAYYVGGDYVIKFSAHLGSIKNGIKITTALQTVGMPTYEIVKSIHNSDYIQDGELYFVVMKCIKGTPLMCKDIFDNTNLAMDIGKNIAKLHRAFSVFDNENYTTENLYNNTIKSALPKVSGLIDLNKSFLVDYIDKMNEFYDKLPKQVIHRDINPSNIIFDNGTFKGFVDFDLSEVNIRLFDICYCATAILSEYFTNPNMDTEKWKEILSHLVSGYESITPLTEEEKLAIPYVLISIQIICIAHFSQFDKYSELNKINIDMLQWMIKNRSMFNQ